MPIIAIYDVSVLYSALVRDLLMHLALTDLVQAKWTETIHEEWTRSLLKNRPELKKEKLDHVCTLMNTAIPDALVTGYEEHIPLLVLPDPNDRHVLAAAIDCRAKVIVTFNLKDFPAFVLEKYDIEAQHPDDFASNLLELDASAVVDAVKRQCINLVNPPKTVDELLRDFEKQGLKQFVEALGPFRDDLEV